MTFININLQLNRISEACAGNYSINLPMLAGKFTGGWARVESSCVKKSQLLTGDPMPVAVRKGELERVRPMWLAMKLENRSTYTAQSHCDATQGSLRVYQAESSRGCAEIMEWEKNKKRVARQLRKRAGMSGCVGKSGWESRSPALNCSSVICVGRGV